MRIEKLDVGIVKAIVSLLNQVIIFVILVGQLITSHVLGFDLKEYDRFHFRKKSIYQRKYHYEKKVDQVSKSLHLAEDEKCELYNNLMNIDEHVMEILNNQFCRKRMISIFYLIKKFLEEMANEKSKLVYLKISPQTLVNYEKWWNSYINLKK